MAEYDWFSDTEDALDSSSEKVTLKAFSNVVRMSCKEVQKHANKHK